MKDLFFYVEIIVLHAEFLHNCFAHSSTFFHFSVKKIISRFDHSKMSQSSKMEEDPIENDQEMKEEEIDEAMEQDIVEEEEEPETEEEGELADIFIFEYLLNS